MLSYYDTISEIYCKFISPQKYEDDFLFEGNALKLQSIGYGYSRRITFAAGPGQLNKNDNYFYSDSRRYGFAFQPQLVSVGEKYTIYDVSHHPLGHLEIIQIQVIYIFSLFAEGI